MNLAQVIDAVRALTPEEQAQVRRLLDTLNDEPQPLMTEDEFEQYLAAKGIGTPPEPMTEEELAQEQAAFDAYEPIEVKGIPLSQMIIEERR